MHPPPLEYLHRENIELIKTSYPRYREARTTSPRVYRGVEVLIPTPPPPYVPAENRIAPTPTPAIRLLRTLIRGSGVEAVAFPNFRGNKDVRLRTRSETRAPIALSSRAVSLTQVYSFHAGSQPPGSTPKQYPRIGVDVTQRPSLRFGLPTPTLRHARHPGIRLSDIDGRTPDVLMPDLRRSAMQIPILSTSARSPVFPARSIRT